MDCEERIKLNGIGFKANTNLYQFKMTYTNGAESATFNTQEGATENAKVYPVRSEKTISCVEILHRADQHNIYGIRFLDDRGNKIQERQWRQNSTAKWVKIEVPEGMEVIGFHGSHDGSYIKQLGLVLWEPNPYAQ